MEKAALDRADGGRTPLTDALGASDVALNFYRLDPGERLSQGLHAHLDQEEVFFVLDGEATFETLRRDGDGVESSRVTVDEGELVRFPPGEYQSGSNEADRSLAVLALGAPQGTSAFRVPVPCSRCGHDATRPDLADGREVLVCPECGAETGGTCGECGEEALGATVADGRVVSVCRNCGAESKH